MNKVELRAKCLEERKKLNTKAISAKIVKDLAEAHILDNYEHIGIYYPIGAEINVLDIINLYPQKSFYLPITRENISFLKYKPGDTLIKGPFHTMEPIGAEISRDEIECFIIPCVGISKNKRRIGYGKGYYDRYLEGYHGMKIGVCYSGASELDIELGENDVMLDYICKG